MSPATPAAAGVSREPQTNTIMKAIAEVACGLPIVGYGEPNSSFPISKAGVEFVPWQDRDALAKALCRVLSDGEQWNDLHERSLRAQANYFSWEVIARHYQKVLSDG